MHVKKILTCPPLDNSRLHTLASYIYSSSNTLHTNLKYFFFPNMPKAKKKSTKVVASITYPVLHWIAENFSLTWAMIIVLSEFDAIQQTI